VTTEATTGGTVGEAVGVGTRPAGDAEVVDYPGAQAPARHRDVMSHGVRLAVHEWGDADAPPLLLAHGGFDFGRTYDVFAPLLAAAGWRPVVWDQRGHGDSQHADLYSWDTDVRDAVAVLDTLGPGPVPVVGHSKGGAVMVQLATSLPHRVRALVNIDGLPSRRNSPDVPEHQRTKMMAGELAAWLDHRRALGDRQRRPGTLDGLAERRARMNPRLRHEWLRYLVTVGARLHADGWRWKIDPVLRLGGFGPWRPEWAIARLPGLSMPLLAILGMQPEMMGWGTLPEDIVPNLPPGGRLETFHDTGHFVHIEQPRRVADLVLDFLGTPA
jgi:pimeloyl-ACP methyl ester carboxylesterase